MGTDKVFAMTVAGEKSFAIREELRLHTSGDTSRFKAVYAVDSALLLVEPSIFTGAGFSFARELKGVQYPNLSQFLDACKKEGEPIYYSLNNLTYICVQTITKEKDEVTKNVLNIYMPVDVEDKKLICREVTVTFPKASREALADSYKDYVLSRFTRLLTTRR